MAGLLDLFGLNATKEGGGLLGPYGGRDNFRDLLLAVSSTDPGTSMAALRNSRAGKSTDDLREMQAENLWREQKGQKPLSPMEYITAVKQAGATRINNAVNTADGFAAAQTKARIAVDTDAAKKASDIALSATRLTPLLNQVEALADKTPGGWAGPINATLARAFSGAGFEVPEKMSNAELLQSISQRLVPIVREPGPTSEKELGIYLQAVPGLMQSPEGRKKVVQATKKINERAVEIAKVYRQHIGSPNLYEELGKLDRPIFAPNEFAAPTSNAPASTAPSPGQTSTGVKWRVVR